MGKDRRLFAKITLEFPHHRKIAILSDAAFRCLVEAILYAREQTTDGVLARRYAIARWGLDVLQELSQNDEEKPSLTECEKGWLVHDFAEHQDTREEIEARSEKNRLAGQKGGLAKAKHGAKQPAKRRASKSPSENLAETETETETHEVPASAGTSRAHQRRQPNFSEQLRGAPDPIPDAPPDDQGARPISSTAAAALVREVIPANRYPSAVLTDLRLRVSALLHEGTDADLVRDTLRLWDQRDGGPGLLPHLLADAAKARHATAAPTTAYERKSAQNAQVFARLAEQNPPPPIPVRELTK